MTRRAARALGDRGAVGRGLCDRPGRAGPAGGQCGGDRLAWKNLVFTGPPGAGRSRAGCCLRSMACRQGGPAGRSAATTPAGPGSPGGRSARPSAGWPAFSPRPPPPAAVNTPPPGQGRRCPHRGGHLPGPSAPPGRGAQRRQAGPAMAMCSLMQVPQPPDRSSIRSHSSPATWSPWPPWVVAATTCRPASGSVIWP